MCTYVTEKAAVLGSAKGPAGWFRVDTATVYYDHPYHAPLDHSLNIDFVNEAEGAPTRVAVELSADSARELARRILAVLDSPEVQPFLPATRARRRGYPSPAAPPNIGPR